MNNALQVPECFTPEMYHVLSTPETFCSFKKKISKLSVIWRSYQNILLSTSSLSLSSKNDITFPRESKTEFNWQLFSFVTDLLFSVTNLLFTVDRRQKSIKNKHDDLLFLNKVKRTVKTNCGEISGRISMIETSRAAYLNLHNRNIF